MKILILIPILILSLHAQENNQKKPLKHETGDVTIAANDAADYYSRKNFSDLKKIRTSCINLTGEESFKKLLTDFIRGKSLLQAGRYSESRRLLEENAKGIGAKTEEIIKFYREASVKMGEEAGRLSVELTLENEKGNNYLIPVINKNLKNSNESIKMAEDMVRSSNLTDALYYYKSSVNSLVKAIYYYNKSGVRGLTTKQKAEKNVLIDDDLLPKEFLKEYDDSMDKLHTEEQAKREKQRDYSRRVLGLKQDKQPEKNEPAKAEDKKETTEAVQ